MLTEIDAAIIAWTRQQILQDDELTDMVEDGPWAVDTDAHAVISADTGDSQPSGFPQAIKPVRPGVLTEAVAETFDPPEGPPHTAAYLLAVADPQVFRDGQRSRLAMLETCHRLLAASAGGGAIGGGGAGGNAGNAGGGGGASGGGVNTTYPGGPGGAGSLHSDTSGSYGAGDASAVLAGRFLRLLAAGYRRRPGYDPAWAVPAARSF